MLKAVGNFFGINNIPIYLIIIGVGIYGYLRIEALKSENDALAAEYVNVADKNEKLASDLTKFMDGVNRDLSAQKRINNTIERVNEENRSRIDELQDTFNKKANGEPRDLDKIAKAKPTLLERRINDATKKVFDDIEEFSNTNVDSK